MDKRSERISKKHTLTDKSQGLFQIELLVIQHLLSGWNTDELSSNDIVISRSSLYVMAISALVTLLPQGCVFAFVPKECKDLFTGCLWLAFALSMIIVYWLFKYIWTMIKKYLKYVINECKQMENPAETRRLIKQCKINKDDVSSIGIVIGVLEITITEFAAIFFDNYSGGTHYALYLTNIAVLSPLFCISLSQYRFFSILSANLEDILLTKESEHHHNHD